MEFLMMKLERVLTVDNDPPNEVIKHIMNSCEVVKNGKRLLKLKK